MPLLDRRTVLLTGLSAAAAALGPRAVLAGTTILEVGGFVAAPAPHRFDLEGLRALGAVELVTTTPWTEGEVRFEGVPVGRLLQSCGATGTTLRATALNEYAIEIPIADFADPRVVLAWSANGRILSVREKGPLWLVYPWSEDAKYRTGLYESRSIWQLARLEVV